MLAFTPFVQVATYATRHFATFGLAPAAAPISSCGLGCIDTHRAWVGSPHHSVLADHPFSLVWVRRHHHRHCLGELGLGGSNLRLSHLRILAGVQQLWLSASALRLWLTISAGTSAFERTTHKVRGSLCLSHAVFTPLRTLYTCSGSSGLASSSLAGLGRIALFVFVLPGSLGGIAAIDWHQLSRHRVRGSHPHRP
jgi:hypothetical protein